MRNDKNVYKTRTEVRNGKYIKVAESAKKYDTDRNNSNYGCTAANQQTHSHVAPVWQKAALTIEEAAAYSNIGITKLYEITNNPICSFVLHVGTRKRLIKRKEFEKYLSQSIEI